MIHAKNKMNDKWFYKIRREDKEREYYRWEETRLRTEEQRRKENNTPEKLVSSLEMLLPFLKEQSQIDRLKEISEFLSEKMKVVLLGDYEGPEIEENHVWVMLRYDNPEMEVNPHFHLELNGVASTHGFYIHAWEFTQEGWEHVEFKPKPSGKRKGSWVRVGANRYEACFE